MKNFILLFATAFIIFAAQAQTQRTVQGIVRNDLKIAKSAAKAAETDKTFIWSGDTVGQKEKKDAVLIW